MVGYAHKLVAGYAHKLVASYVHKLMAGYVRTISGRVCPEISGSLWDNLVVWTLSQETAARVDWSIRGRRYVCRLVVGYAHRLVAMPIN